MVSAFFMFYQSIPIRAYSDTVCCWWASPSDTLMNLLIRYPHIPFYFRFSFTSSTSSIHHYAPLHQCDHTTITLASSDRWWASSSDTLIYPSIFTFPSLSLHCQSTTTHRCSDTTTHDHACARMTIALALSDWSHLFDGHMTYDSHVFTSILSVSNMPPPAVWPITSSRTTWSGTFYSFTICSHSCLPFVFNLPVFTFHQGRSLPKPQPIAYMSLPQNWDFALISHYFALHCTAMIPLSLLATIHLETIPYPQIAPPQSPIGFILRSLAL